MWTVARVLTAITLASTLWLAMPAEPSHACIIDEPLEKRMAYAEEHRDLVFWGRVKNIEPLGKLDIQVRRVIKGNVPLGMVTVRAWSSSCAPWFPIEGETYKVMGEWSMESPGEINGGRGWPDEMPKRWTPLIAGLALTAVGVVAAGALFWRQKKVSDVGRNPRDTSS